MECWQELGLLGLFLSSFVSATIVPLSSELVFAYFVTQGFSAPLIIFLASLGNIIGGMTNFFLGKLNFWKTLSKYFGLKPERVKQIAEKYGKYGSLSAVLCWLPIIGDVIAVSLGFLRLRFLPVLIWMSIGKTLRYVILYLFLTQLD